MDEKLKKALSLAITGYLTYSVIVFPMEENPHMHQPQYEYIHGDNFGNYSVVVSGTSSGVELPNYIEDLEASPLNPTERLYGITIPTSDYI